MAILTKYFYKQVKRHNGIMLSTEQNWRKACKNNSKHIKHRTKQLDAKRAARSF